MMTGSWPSGGFLLFAALSSAACTPMPGKENVQKFATALSAASSSVDTAVARLSDLEQDSSMEDRNALFLRPVRPGGQEPIVPRMPSTEALNAEAARIALGDFLEFLRAYAENLTALAGGEEVASAQAAVAAAASEVKGAVVQLGRLGAQQKQDADAVSAAVSAAVQVLIERRAASAVSEAVRQAHPDIVRIADYISARVIGDGSEGISWAVTHHYDRLVSAQGRSLARIRLDPNVNAYEKDRAYREAAARQRANFALLDTPAAARAALDRMVKAHAKLVEPATAGEAVQEFVRAVDRLAALYQAGLPAKASQ